MRRSVAYRRMAVQRNIRTLSSRFHNPDLRLGQFNDNLMKLMYDY